MHRRSEREQGVSPVGDDADICGVEDRRGWVMIDSQDCSGPAGADQMVEHATDADRDQQPACDAAPGDADLARTGLPALVGYVAGGGQFPAECLQQRVQQRVFGGGDPSANGHHDLRRAEVFETVVASPRHPMYSVVPGPGSEGL